MKSHAFTQVELSSPTEKINQDDTILTLGSCFADSIGSKLKNSKMHTLVNPLGILFNPISIAKGIQYINGKATISQEDCHKNGSLYFHYDFHSCFTSMSDKETSDNINEAIKLSQQHIKTAKWLLITLGTSFVHVRKDKGEVVANCHKMPAQLFEKKLLTIEESVQKLSATIPSDMNVIITVSPVRHTKEGIVENQRSKARLIEVAHNLVDTYDNWSYFPAYEILMDELRGYRYYKADLIHPTDEAVDIIWEKFINTYMTDGANQKISDIDKLNMSISHKPLVSKSVEYQQFCKNMVEKVQHLKIKYPECDFKSELATLESRLL